jgi:hypothetical protein
MKLYTPHPYVNRAGRLAHGVPGQRDGLGELTRADPLLQAARFRAEWGAVRPESASVKLR